MCSPTCAELVVLKKAALAISLDFSDKGSLKYLYNLNQGYGVGTTIHLLETSGGGGFQELFAIGERRRKARQTGRVREKEVLTAEKRSGINGHC